MATEVDFSQYNLTIKDIEVPEKDKWKNYTSEKIFKRIINYLHNSYSLNKKYLSVIDVWQTVAIFNLYTENFYLNYVFNDYGNHDFIDDYCTKIAKNNKLLIVGLEEPFLHFKYIKNIYCNCEIPTKEQSEKAINFIDSIVILLKNNQYNYIPPDTAELKNYFKMNLDYCLNCNPGESVYADYLKIRNDLWISKLDAAFKVRSTFVAVGLHHLYFNFGLINLFRGLGYKVEPIKISFHEKIKVNRYNF